MSMLTCNCEMPSPATAGRRDLLERAWVVLVDTARAGKTISYGELALAVGLPHLQRSIHRRVVAPLCSGVCQPNGYPDIASLVVRKDSGRPGDGWWSEAGGINMEMWRDELARVHAFQWPDHLPL